MRRQGIPAFTFMGEVNNTDNEYVRKLTKQKYEFGFTTDVRTEIIEKGLNEDVIRLISDEKGKPGRMLEFHLKACRH